MHIWTSQVGYPVVKVTETSEGITLQQNRFLQSADIKPKEDEVIYPILTSLIIGRETEVPVQFTTRTLDIPLKSHEFFKLNKGQNGFYRTLYTPERLLKLGEATKTGTLGVKDQMGLIADTGALAASGYQKTSALLGLLLSMSSETSANVWDLIVANLSLVEEAFKLKSTAISEGLKRFKRDLTAPRAHQLGWNVSSGSDALLIKNKVTLFLAAGQSGDKKYESVIVIPRLRHTYNIKQVHRSSKTYVQRPLHRRRQGSNEFRLRRRRITYRFCRRDRARLQHHA